ncbi:MAG TPA: lysophospholipid acyltransferase family protein [Sphingobacteriaceae bacterium]
MNKFFFSVIAAVIHLVSLLPFPVLYLLSDGLFIVLYYVVRYRRTVVQENLRNSFPGKTAAELGEIEKKHYRYLADLIVESVKMKSMSRQEILKRFRYVNFEELEPYFSANRPVIAVTAHYGNWEWGSPSLSLVNPYPSLVVYKPQTDKRFENLINRMRSRFGSVMVPMKLTLRKVLEYKNRPNMLVLVGDQTPPREESQFFTGFLNQPTAIFLGVEKIARLTNNPVVFFHIDRVKRGHYEATLKTLFEDPKETSEHEITLAHTRELERIIMRKPELWLWTHKRWKFKPEEISR